MGKMPIMGMEAAGSSFSTAYVCGLPSSDAMRIDDLLDFSEQDDLFDATAALPESIQSHILPLHEISSTAGYLDSSVPQMCTFSDDLYIPSEEVAELEWLSKFVDDSFSDIPFPSCQGWSGGNPVPSSNSSDVRSDPSTVPCRVRSKRSKAPVAALQQAASTAWSSPQQSSSSATSSSSSSSSSEFPPGVASSNPKAPSTSSGRKKETRGEDGGVRRCTHCSSEKTPQWRTGPLGPKTLCNACGVRFKSGRLVPEYRPAASPTFVLTQHSNSHRKVLELRRQKDVLRQPGSSATAVVTSPRPELLYRDYEVC
ncbi:unnamed protein product [Spirodela intermedia]|uniref:GATA transcription factor n=1 Tax=Spirodela intermedia TaxID=51605 RepID=A0A7I8L0U4_SPIIN|nr:unnamed protein product [Spirodela intermedia]